MCSGCDLAVSWVVFNCLSRNDDSIVHICETEHDDDDDPYDDDR